MKQRSSQRFLRKLKERKPPGGGAGGRLGGKKHSLPGPRGVSRLLPYLPYGRGVPLGQPRSSSPLFTVSLSGPHGFRAWMTLHLCPKLRACPAPDPHARLHTHLHWHLQAPQLITPSPNLKPWLDSSCFSPRLFPDSRKGVTTTQLLKPGGIWCP